MIIVGRFEVDPADRDAFLATRHDAVAASRLEDGCLRYVVSADPLEPGVVHLFEHWTSKRTLAAHLQVLKQRPRPEGRAIPIVASHVAQYEAGPPKPVGS
jgi:hypothetical protein